MRGMMWQKPQTGLNNPWLTGAYPGERKKMNKAIVTLEDGSTQEVELSSITLPEGHSVFDGKSAPEGYVSQQVFDHKVKSFKDQVRRSLSVDDEFRRSILEAAGVPMDDTGKYQAPKGNDVDMDALKKSVIAEMVNPLKSSLEDKDKTISNLLESKKRSEILAAAIELGVREEFLKPLNGKDGASAWENMVSNMYGYDPQANVFAVKAGEGFAYNPSGTTENPYLTIAAHGEALKKDEAFSSFFKIEGQEGSDFRNDGTLSVPGTVTRDMITNGTLSDEELKGVAEGRIRVR